MKNSKFRAWDKQNEIMHNDFQFIKSGEEGNDWIIFTSDKQSLKDEQHPFENPYFRQQLIIMEDVGIGEFFEGDIVDFDGHLGVVRYNGEGFYIDFDQIPLWLSKTYIKPSVNYTIVGNVFENPELMANLK